MSKQLEEITEEMKTLKFNFDYLQADYNNLVTKVKRQKEQNKKRKLLHAQQQQHGEMEQLGSLLKKSIQTIGQAKKQSLSMNRSMTSPNLLNSLHKPKVQSIF